MLESSGLTSSIEDWCLADNRHEESCSSAKVIILSLAMLAGVDVDNLPSVADEQNRLKFEKEMLKGIALNWFPKLQREQLTVEIHD